MSFRFDDRSLGTVSRSRGSEVVAKVAGFRGLCHQTILNHFPAASVPVAILRAQFLEAESWRGEEGQGGGACHRHWRYRALP